MFFQCLFLHLDCMCDLGSANEVGRRQRQCGCKVQGVKNERMLRLYEQFGRHARQEVSDRDFSGVSYDDLVYAEKCFDLRVLTVLAF